MPASHHEIETQRVAAYLRHVIRPAIFGDTAPLRVQAWQTRHRVPVDAVPFDGMRTVPIGFRWGPAWSTCWFRVQGEIPEAWADECVALRFSSGTEALLFEDGAPHQGFDSNRRFARLSLPAGSGRQFDRLIEAACNHWFGINAFAWDPIETQWRWNSAEPGELQQCDLAVFRERVWRLAITMDFAVELLTSLKEDDAVADVLRRACAHAIRTVRDDDVDSTADEARGVVIDALAAMRDSAPGERTRCMAAGHAHIDTAWLWPIAETRRKCERSWSNVIGIMDRDPDLVFTASQPQQYEWVQADAPALFERIAGRVRDGRWEPVGAMWVEPDAILPSGESLIRQILRGQSSFASMFGDGLHKRILFLPDTFGFPAALPGIMRAAHLDTFVTNKLNWNRRHAFDHTSFRWIGLDDSEVIGHLTPGGDYNARVSVEELKRGQERVRTHAISAGDIWFQPFGFGDGGGGPTDDMVERIRLANACPALPETTCATMHDFAAQLHMAPPETRVNGELLLELHRGVFTTCRWLKSANHRGERLLRRLEWFAAMEAEASRTDPDLQPQWDHLLLHQFHDILPGTSVREVYDDARGAWKRFEAWADIMQDAWSARWQRRFASESESESALPLSGAVVMNPHADPASTVIEIDGHTHWAEAVPAFGGRAVASHRDAVSPPPPSVTAEAGASGFTLENELVSANFDVHGDLQSIEHKPSGNKIVPNGDANGDANGDTIGTLALYEDRPYEWDAWEIDPEYLEKRLPLDEAGGDRSVVLHDSDPLRVRLSVAHGLGRRSRVTQTWQLDAGASSLTVLVDVHWQEDHRLLRLLVPTGIDARVAQCGTTFGMVERAAHRDTSEAHWQFETPCHGWMNLQESGRGIALLAEAIHGRSAIDGVLGASLLRAPGHPDPTMDRGFHRMRVAIMPHAGDWREAGVAAEADLLAEPMWSTPIRGDSDSSTVVPPPFKISGAARGAIEIHAFRTTENGRELRVGERHGEPQTITIAWNQAEAEQRVRDVFATDVYGDRWSPPGVAIKHDALSRETTLTFAPFSWVTLAVV